MFRNLRIAGISDHSTIATISALPLAVSTRYRVFIFFISTRIELTFADLELISLGCVYPTQVGFSPVCILSVHPTDGEHSLPT